MLPPFYRSAGLLVVVLAIVAAGCGGSKADGPQVLEVTLVNEGCSPEKLTARSGSVTFEVENGGTSRVSELEIKQPDGVILGEKENVVGEIRAAFTLTLQPGRYVLSCPTGDDDNQGELIVSGEAVASPSLPRAELNVAVAAYRVYVADQVRLLGKGVNRFAAALRAGDLAKAKALFGPVRLNYERIEPVAERLRRPRPEARIEQILWVRGRTTGTAQLAKQLRADVATLERKVGLLHFQPPQLANGAVELLDEVANSKITGEEDRYSHTDLSDFQGNLEGSRKAFELLRPALLEEGERKLVQTIAARFAAVQAGLDKYRRATPLRFALYSGLTAADRRTLSQQVIALAEPLSTVAGKVSG